MTEGDDMTNEETALSVGHTADPVGVLPDCCAQRDELWRDVTGWDLLGQVTRRLDSMTAQLNAAKRHNKGRRWPDSKLPQVAEIPLAYGVVLPIPLDVEGTPVSYEQAMSNLMGALATALTVAVGNGRWAVNEHQRAERNEVDQAVMEMIASDREEAEDRALTAEAENERLVALLRRCVGETPEDEQARMAVIEEADR